MKAFIKKYTALAYFILVFAFAWTVWLAAGFFAPRSFLGATLVGAWSPTLIALLIIRVKGGGQALRLFLKGLFKFRVGWYWWLIVVFSIPVIALLSIGIYHLMGGNVPRISYPVGIPEKTPVVIVVLGLFISGIFFGGPLAEDVGWRGFIVPELHKTMHALKAALLVGIIWVVWHLPFFWFKEGAQVVGFLPLPWFAILTMAWAVLFAWVYFNTKSLLMPVLYHSSINTTLGVFGVLNSQPSTPNTALLLINALLTWAFVGLVVWRFGSRTLAGEKNYRFTSPELN
jgi:uncharacterized protein